MVGIIGGVAHDPSACRQGREKNTSSRPPRRSPPGRASPPPGWRRPGRHRWSRWTPAGTGHRTLCQRPPPPQCRGTGCSPPGSGSRCPPRSGPAGSPGSLRDDPGQPVQVLRRVAGRGGLGLVSGQPGGPSTSSQVSWRPAASASTSRGRAILPSRTCTPCSTYRALPLTST